MESDQTAKRPKKHSLGKYCVAGGPGNVSCTNDSKTEGISMHMSRVMIRFVRNGFASSKGIGQNGNHRRHQCFVRYISTYRTLNIKTT